MRPIIKRVPVAVRLWSAVGVLITTAALTAALSFGALMEMGESSDQLAVAAKRSAHAGSVIDGLGDLRAALLRDVVLHRRPGDTGSSDAVEREIARLAGLYGSPASTGQRQLDALTRQWRSGNLMRVNAPPERTGEAQFDAIADAVAPLESAADAEARAAEHRAVAAAAHGADTRSRAQWLVAACFFVFVALAVALRRWLIRALVPRLRAYARFAADVAAGAAAGRLNPRGIDELDDLGRSLDELVARHERELSTQREQATFVDALQVAESDDDAHELIRRHLELTIGGSQVAVLTRDEATGRLESRTSGVVLPKMVEGVAPRSCQAIRLGRTNEGGPDALLSCDVCGGRPGLTTCSPLLAGGEVIGSILVAHPAPLDAGQRAVIQESVYDAAPTLLNLRNLGRAELQAATDSLTGLPNRRALEDTLERMRHQALRAGTMLGVVMVDVDRFKEINDSFGHDRGDDVLAAVATTMRGAVRESDFVGRYGGEEFLVLLPDTDLDGALAAAEKLREAIAATTVPELDRAVTASAGVAVLPRDGHDSDTVLRTADRALYSAKANGRNRVETAEPLEPRTPPLV